MRKPGDIVHRYTIVTLIGRGGMGEIYEATDTLLERRVAFKLIPDRGDEEARGDSSSDRTSWAVEWVRPRRRWSPT